MGSSGGPAVSGVGVGFYFGDQIEADLAGCNRGDLRMEDASAGDHVRLHAGLCAQNADHVLGLCGSDGCGGLVPVFSDPASARHAACLFIPIGNGP